MAVLLHYGQSTQVWGQKLMSYTNWNNIHLHSWILLHFGWHLHHHCRNRRSNFYFLVATQQNCLESKAKQGPNHNCRVMGSLSALLEKKCHVSITVQRIRQNLVKMITRLSYSDKTWNAAKKQGMFTNDLITEPNKSHPLVHVYHLVVILVLKQRALNVG